MASPLRTLIVEDHQSDVQLLVLELGRGGFQPTFRQVDSAEAMAQALDGESWDVVLADHSVPRFSAPEALALLKRSGRDVPFIVVSGAIGEETAVALLKAGAHDYVSKNNLALLVPAIERELRDAEVRRARARAEDEIRRLNAELEQRVVERTAQLAAANRALERDAEERKRLLEELQGANKRISSDIEQLRELQERQKEVVELVSHDLRAPLTGILGTAQLSGAQPRAGWPRV